jgi:hypothetical protein
MKVIQSQFERHLGQRAELTKQYAHDVLGVAIRVAALRQTLLGSRAHSWIDLFQGGENKSKELARVLILFGEAEIDPGRLGVTARGCKSIGQESRLAVAWAGDHRDHPLWKKV